MDAVAGYIRMDHWFKTIAGQRLQTEIETCLAQVDLGYLNKQFLQIGSLGENLWLSNLPFKHKWLMNLYESRGSDVVGWTSQLPFPKDSIEVVFAPFLFEFGMDPWSIVSELDRVVESMGYVIIVGLNPLAMWKSSRLLTRKSHYKWYQAFKGYSYWSVKAMFRSLGYEQTNAQFFYYIPPVKTKRFLDYYNLVNHFAKLIAPYPPSFFMLTMQKRQEGFVCTALEKTPLW